MTARSGQGRNLRWAGLEAVLLIAAVAVGAYTYTLWNSALDARDQRDSAESRLATASDDLAALRSGAVAADLQKQIDELKTTVPTRFPPRADALAFGTAITDFAVAQGLVVDAFDFSSTSYSAGGIELPAISYAFDAHGASEALIGLLSVPVSYPTAVVRKLGLARLDSGQWTLAMIVIVVHSGA